MENIKSKKTAKFTVTLICAIAALAFSGVATVIAGNVIPGNGIINAVASIFVGILTACVLLGVALAVIGAVYKAKFEIAASAVLFYVALVLVLVVCALFSAKWWLPIIIAIIALPILILCLLLIYRNDLVLVTDNQKPDYQDWKTREVNKKEEPKQEDLPEIKSFK